MSYFAAGLAHTDATWHARELKLDDAETIDDIGDLLRAVDEDANTWLLLVEEDDEYIAIMRLTPDGEPRVFVSDGRATDTFPIATLLGDGAERIVPADEDDEDLGPDAEPLGDPDLLADLGTSAGELMALCAHEGTLPLDVTTAVCEKAGCADQLEELRDGVA